MLTDAQAVVCELNAKDIMTKSADNNNPNILGRYDI